MRTNQSVFLEAGRRIAEGDCSYPDSTCLTVAEVSAGTLDYWTRNRHVCLYAKYFGTESYPFSALGVRRMGNNNIRVLAMCLMAAITAPRKRRK